MFEVSQDSPAHSLPNRDGTRTRTLKLDRLTDIARAVGPGKLVAGAIGIGWRFHSG